MSTFTQTTLVRYARWVLVAASIAVTAACGGGGGGGGGGQSNQSSPATLAAQDAGSAPTGCFAKNTTGISISAKASRVTGVAPLSVIFDATGTTNGAANPFHNLNYLWNFGDSKAGEWRATTASYTSRNIATGAMAGHVFEKAGTYIVELTVSGASDQKKDTCLITVTSPEDHLDYKGAKTACIGKSMPVAGVDECPLNSITYKADADLGKSIHIVITDALAAGAKRVLLKKGDVFMSNGSITATAVGPIYIGAYGSAADKPKINMPATGGYLVNLRNSPSDWTFSNIELDGQGTNVKFSASSGTNTPEHILFYKLTIRNAGGMGVIGSNISIVDTDIGPVVGGGGNVGVWAESVFGFFFSGNMIVDATLAEHGMRIQGAKNGVVSHNRFSNAATTKNVFTLRGNDVVPYVTDKIVVSDNLFESTKNSPDNWLVAIAPQNTSRKEEIRDILVERNMFRVSASYQRALVIEAFDVTVRNNLFDLSDVSGGIEVGRSNVAGLAAPAGINIFHNSFFSKSGNYFSAVAFSSASVSNVSVKNNFAYAKSASFNSTGNGPASFLNSVASVGVVEEFNTQNQNLQLPPNVVGIDDLSISGNWKPVSQVPGSTFPLPGAEYDFQGGLRSSAVNLGAFKY